MIALQKRLTHTYVGTYQHLDQWMDIGSIDEIGRRELPLSEEDEQDPCDHKSWEIFCLVTLASDIHETWLNSGDGEKFDFDFYKWSVAQTERALHDTYTEQGCAHEWDCCGCRSYYAEKVERVTGDLWKVVVSSSRNF